MGRSYAGVLGLVAFLTTLGRGLIHTADFGPTLRLASIYLFVFAALGYVAGQVAGWIMLDSVRQQLAAEVAAQQADKPGSPRAATR